MRQEIPIILALLAIAGLIATFLIIFPSNSDPSNQRPGGDENSQGSKTTIQGEAIKDTPKDKDKTPQIPSEQSQSFNECSPESKLVEECEPIDHPVCGWYDTEITCSWGPCSKSTFPNECEACRTPNVFYWTFGDCPLHG